MSAIQPNCGIRSFLLSAIRENRLAGCYIIEGAEGTGKRSVARFAASALCCMSPHADKTPCGTCLSCRHIRDKAHVDVFELSPEDGKQISVDEVRELIKNTYVLPSESDWQVFILEQCEHLNKAAQNALLKSIEEPRDHTVFFLLTTDRTKLLPTVRSRAVHLRTEPLKKDEIRKILEQEGVSQEHLDEASLLSQGSLGKARAMAKDPEIHATRQLVLDYLNAIMNGAGFSKLSLILPPASVSRKDLALFLPMFKLALRDLILKRFQIPSSPLFFTDEVLLDNLASILSPEAALSLFDRTEEMTVAMDANANVFSALSDFHLRARKLTRVDK